MSFTDDLAALVRDTPPALATAPTPCHDWDVAALIGHLHQVGAALDLAMSGAPVPAGHWGEPFPGYDLSALSWAGPPATVDMGGMVMPGRTVADMLVADLVLHGWDLARATGRALPVPAELAGTTLTFLTAFQEQGRRMGLFGPPVEVPAGAGDLDRALGLSGRDPAWSACDTPPGQPE
ncbi:TIGR03086 family metal-binding protein [Actinoplanes sp. URMC 104]|uniref:TIGR03086 family metal-binding protein n=1 Tax=Actinoplanes sp. URMC 104 TaxID=3423409 RepID=UPI003F1CE9D4